MLAATPCMGEEIKRIVLLETMPVKVVLDHTHWFKTQMRDLGYREGVNMELTVLNATGVQERADSLLEEALANNKPNLLVTNATMASKAGVKLLQGTGIPQLFFTVSDPVGAGIIEKVGIATGKNITGRVHTTNRETKITLALRLIRGSTNNRPIRIGFIHSTYPSAIGDLRELKAAAAKNKDVKFISHAIEYRQIPEELNTMIKELPGALKRLEGKIDYLWEPLGPFGESSQYNQFLQDHASVPVIFGATKESAELGALMFLTSDPEAEGRETALLADKILKGADPGTIPVVPPLKFKLGLNLSTAQKMGIVIHPSILKLAGKNIYR